MQIPSHDQPLCIDLSYGQNMRKGTQPCPPLTLVTWHHTNEHPEWRNQGTCHIRRLMIKTLILTHSGSEPAFYLRKRRKLRLKVRILRQNFNLFWIAWMVEVTCDREIENWSWNKVYSYDWIINWILDDIFYQWWK